MEAYFLAVIVNLLRQGHSIEAIELAMKAELEILEQSKPLLEAQAEAKFAP